MAGKCCRRIDVVQEVRLGCKLMVRLTVTVGELVKSPVAVQQGWSRVRESVFRGSNTLCILTFLEVIEWRSS